MATATGSRNGIADLAAAEEFVRFFTQGWAQSKPDGFVVHFRSRMHPQVRLEQPGAPVVHGPDGFESSFRALFDLFPDYRVEVDDWAARGDTVYLWLTHRATVGRRRVSYQGVDRIVLEDGLIRERIAVFDSAVLARATMRAPGTWPRLIRWRATGVRFRR